MRLKVLLICSVLFDFLAAGAEEKLLPLDICPQYCNKAHFHNEKQMCSCLGINQQFIQFINAPIITLDDFNSKGTQKRSLSKEKVNEDSDNEDEEEDENEQEEEDDDYVSTSPQENQATQISKRVRHAPEPSTKSSEIKKRPTTAPSPVDIDFFLGPVGFNEINVDHLSALGKVIPFTFTTSSPSNPRKLLILPFKVEIIPNPDFNETALQRKAQKKKPSPSLFFKREQFLPPTNGNIYSPKNMPKQQAEPVVEANPVLPMVPTNMFRPQPSPYGYQQMYTGLLPKSGLNNRLPVMNVPYRIESKEVGRMPFPRSLDLNVQRLRPPSISTPQEMRYMIEPAHNSQPISSPTQCFNRRHWIVVSNNRALRSLPQFLRVWDKCNA